jgi:hypothetical protein
MKTDLIQERLVNDGEETDVGEAAMVIVLSLKFSTEEWSDEMAPNYTSVRMIKFKLKHSFSSCE